MKRVVSVNEASVWVALTFSFCEPHSERFFRKRKAFEIVFNLLENRPVSPMLVYMNRIFISCIFKDECLCLLGLMSAGFIRYHIKHVLEHLFFLLLFIFLTDIPRQVTTHAAPSHRVPLSIPSLVFNLLPLFKHCVICHCVGLKLD